jgi:hypothetical protein
MVLHLGSVSRDGVDGTFGTLGLQTDPGMGSEVKHLGGGQQVILTEAVGGLPAAFGILVELFYGDVVSAPASVSLAVDVQRCSCDCWSSISARESTIAKESALALRPAVPSLRSSPRKMISLLFSPLIPPASDLPTSRFLETLHPSSELAG